MKISKSFIGRNTLLKMASFVVLPDSSWFPLKLSLILQLLHKHSHYFSIGLEILH